MTSGYRETIKSFKIKYDGDKVIETIDVLCYDLPFLILLKHKPNPKKYIRFKQSSMIRSEIYWKESAIFVKFIPDEVVEEAVGQLPYNTTLDIEYYKL